jgi:predicted negative regulator of RcsB-dependent stress response
MSQSKRAGLLLVILVFCISVAYSGYTFFQKQRLKYQTQGYNIALQQMISAAEKDKEVSITTENKKVRLILIEPQSATPVSTAPQAPKQ